MAKLIIEKTKAFFLICPRCRKKYQSIASGENGRVRCFKCEYLFAESGKEIPRKLWIEEAVDAVRCDNCRELISCTNENLNMLSSIPELLYPNPWCDDGAEGVRSPHLAAVKFRGSWYPPSHFLKKSRSHGLLEADTERDRVTLSMMNLEANREESSFIGIGKSTLAKILWLDGKARGYYTYTRMSPTNRAPTLHQIFVRKEYRRLGHATQMVRDLLCTFPEGEIAVESLNSTFIQVLNKIGEVVFQDGKCKSTGRIVFYTSGIWLTPK